MTDLVLRLRSHVLDRGGSSINGAWTMMLEAADEIQRLTAERDYHQHVANGLADLLSAQMEHVCDFILRKGKP